MVRPGKSQKEIYVTPSGFQNGLEEVLIVVEGVHAPIPGCARAQSSRASAGSRLRRPRIRRAAGRGHAQTVRLADADRMIEQYRKIGEAEKHVYGERGNGRAELQHQLPTTPKPTPQAEAPSRRKP